MADPLKPSLDELNIFIAAAVLIAISFIAIRGVYTFAEVGYLLLFSISALLARELGQRIVARWMVAEVRLEFSIEGGAVTLFGALTSFLSGLPVLFLFPVYNEHSVESYEHWGKSIDAMWIKRQYWIVSSGILALFVLWGIFRVLELETGARVVSLFTLFQLMPFDYSMIPTGALDGSIIIRWSGFFWLLFTGSALLMALV